MHPRMHACYDLAQDATNLSRVIGTYQDLSTHRQISIIERLSHRMCEQRSIAKRCVQHK